MSNSFRVLQYTGASPLTVEEAKTYLRVDWSDDDSLIAGLIERAVRYAETVTHRALVLQQIEAVFVIERPQGGEVSGPMTPGPSWYTFQEQLGANPFGPAQFYFDLPLPPYFHDDTHALLIETRIIAFDPWRTYAQTTNTDGSTNTMIDDNREPARLYIRNPVTSNFYRFTYWAGYRDGYPLPADIKRCLLDLIAYWYDNRGADAPVPALIRNSLMARRVDWM